MAVTAAFQLKGDRFPAATYGTTAYSSSAFGGSSWDAETFPYLQLGSDDIRKNLRKKRAGITHERFGLIVASRDWAIVREWTVRINVAPESFFEDLRTYFEARSFYLIQNSESGSETIPVVWVDPEFRPFYVAPGKYGIEFAIQEEIQK